MNRSRALLRRLAVAAVLIAASTAGPAPAGAVVKPGLSIKPGQRIVIKAPSPLLPGKLDIFGGMQPSDCRVTAARLGSSEFCDMYPVTIDASDELILSGNLQLNAVLEWAPGITVSNCPLIGNCGTNEMGMAIYSDPPAQDPDARDRPTAIGGDGFFYGTPDPPIALAHVGVGICPVRYDTKFKLPPNNVCRLDYVDVVNMQGQNPYTLTLELVDFSAGAPVDRSIDDLPPIFDASAQPTSTSATSQPPASPPAPTITSTLLGTSGTLGGFGAPRVDLPGLGGSAGFDGLGPASIPARDLAQKIVQRGPKALGPPAAANALLLVAWLVLLPLGGLGSFLVYLWRRRRAQDVASAAVPS